MSFNYIMKTAMPNTINLKTRTKQRKNFFPTLLLALLTWALWGIIVWKVPPGPVLVLILFHTILFVAIFLTAALALANSRLGLIVSLFFNLCLLFRYFQIGNVVNLLLLAGIFISLGIYLSR
jgi:hypothetical protein